MSKADAETLATIMLEPNEEFIAWTKTLPSKHWAKHDLAACRLGWEAARATLPVEPVAWMFPHQLWPDQWQFTKDDPGNVAGKRPLYAAPLPTTPTDEGMALVARLRELVDGQEGGDAVVLVQRQLLNKVVGQLAAFVKKEG